jgi:hypothetical protein
MSLSRTRLLSLIVAWTVSGCILGPQPEPPEDRAGTVDDPSAGDYDECGCNRGFYDEDDDGIADCPGGEWECDESGCDPAATDGDGDTDADGEDVLPSDDGGEETSIPAHDLVQWPVDPGDIGDDSDGDADMIVVGDY